jgi:ribosomal protein L11 methyltransferase
MPWLALTLRVEPAAAEAFSDALLEAGAQSVWLERGIVGAVVGLDAHVDSLVAEAARASGILPPKFSINTIDDQDWLRASQAQFAPIAIGERLWIGAGWHEAPRGRIAVRIDPGLAFGTGSHPTTRLVLAFLEKAIRGGERVLDYGCGSGILAIAAAKLGAAHVDAVDLDPEAVATARVNAAANGVELNAALPDELPAAGYDIVVSNILAQPLIVLAPLLASSAARIALSGILETQVAEVVNAYERWFDMAVGGREEGWAVLVGVKR